MTGSTRTGEKKNLFEELLDHQERVFHICLGFSRNPRDAEDLTQDAYLKAFRKIESLRNTSLLREWLFRIAKNTCLDHAKKNRIRISTYDSNNEPVESKSPESLVAEMEQLRNLKKTIQLLPKKQREVFVLREYGDLSYQEIAATLRIKEGTVMSRLNRARKSVMNQMRK